MNPQFDHVIYRLVRWLVVLGFFTLPYTHLKWMPDLGTTRPLSLVFFALAFGALLIRQVAVNRLNLRAWWHWPATWDGWPMLRWWLGLLALGAVSAAITPLYGLPVQALTRLLGYMGIFITLFFAAYSVPRYGIQTIARWIFLGYLPVLVYALLEMAGALSVAWATDFVLWFRDEFLVPFHYGNRVALMTTEPSLVAFQMLLLCLLVPYVAEKWLRWCGIILIVVILGFTLSGTVYVLAVIYFGLWFLFSLRRRNLIRLTAVTAFLSTLLVAFYQLIPGIAVFIDRIATAVFSTDRLSSMTVSATIRLNYLLNLVYALIETRGLGLGIGQYGYFWRDIYLRHIDYTRFDRDGEMWAALFVPGDYMKPYSAILGIGVDLGLFGLALLAGFFWQVYRALSGPRLRALFFACLAGLAGAYPIVTPHIWLALGLMTAFGVPKKVEKDPH